MKTNFSILRGFEWMIVCSLLVLSTGCSKKATESAEQPAPSSVQPQTPLQPSNDQQILGQIQSRIQGEPALHGQRIDVNVAGGVATLSGSVDNDASRSLAAADSGAVDGVRTVINNLEVKPSKAAIEAGQAQAGSKASGESCATSASSRCHGSGAATATACSRTCSDHYPTTPTAASASSGAKDSDSPRGHGYPGSPHRCAR